VIDSFHGPAGGTYDFLKKKRVKRLEFFCLTHPHEDHYLGAHKIFRHFTGRIEKIWRFPGLSPDDIKKLYLYGQARAKYLGDAEAGSLANDFRRLVESFARERDRLTDDDAYREVDRPQPLLEHDLYRIEARGPTKSSVAHFKKNFRELRIKSAPLLLSEEGGEMINFVSVILAIAFGKSKIFLLGDAQGSTLAVDPDEDHSYTVVKIAHHGSVSGFGADVLTICDQHKKVNHAILTPLARHRLPRPSMVRSYEQACHRLVSTAEKPRSPHQGVPGMANPRVLSQQARWACVEVAADGTAVQVQ
jgi:hypothetical protein